MGKNIELACLYSNNVSSLNLTYNWVKDHKILNSTSEIIEFKPFEYTDAGHYQCTAFSDDRKMYCGQIALVTGKLGCSYVCLCACVRAYMRVHV